MGGQQFNRRLLARWQNFSRISAIFVMVVGVIALAGWTFDIPILKGLYRGITMKSNAALCLLLSGFSLWVLHWHTPGNLARRAAQWSAVIVSVLGALTLSQHVFGWNLGVDQFLFTEAPGQPGTSSPGRMGLNASLNFMLVGAALFLLRLRISRRVSYAQILAALITSIAVLPIIGYAYGAEQLFGIARYTGIALPTALALFVLGLGIIAARPDHGLAAEITSDRPGGVIARRLLLVGFVIPFILGWFRVVGQEIQLYDTAFGTALLVSVLILIFTRSTWRNAARLNYLEGERQSAEQATHETQLSQKQMELALRESMDILRVISESVPDPVFVKDRDGRIILANPATLHAIGKEAAQVIGRTDAEFYEDANVARELMANDRRIMENGETLIFEEQIPSADTTRIFLSTKAPYRDGQGNVIGLVGIARDVTERKQLEQERERVLAREQAARYQAEEASRMKDEFLAILSHELRTPLNSILGWLHILRKDQLDADQMRHALEVVERSAQSQGKLIEDLLDVSRTITGKLRLEVRPLELRSVVENSIEAHRPAAEAKGVRLETALDSRAGLISGDADRLQQIVWNLLSNAMKFTPKGGCVQVRIEYVESEVHIVVNDTGQGISPDFLPFVFDRFRQMDSSTTRMHGGLGLGLAIVRHLTELHGGTVEAQSPGIGRGATFRVRLPLTAGTSASRPPQPPGHVGVGG